MAQRRMLSMQIIDTDKFIQMPVTTRLLYYDYCMRADDDGFIGSPHKILKMIGCSEDDYKLLILKGYIIPFDDGICVIKHWRIHNYIRKDRYNETQFKEQKDSLVLENNTYEYKEENVGMTGGLPFDTPTGATGKVRLELGKDNKKENKKKKEEVGTRKDSESKKEYGTYKHVELTDKELEALKKDYPSHYMTFITYLDMYIEEKDYKSKSHYLAIKRWVVNAALNNQKSQNLRKPKKTFDEVFEEAMK